MRILQISSGYYPALGGAERHVQALSEELVRLGHQVTVVTMMHKKGLPHFEVMNGVQIHRFPAIGPSKYRIPVGLFRYLVRQKSTFDVVHAHNYHALPLLFAVITFRKHTVISPYYHGSGHTFFGNVLHRLYDPLAYSTFRWVGDFVCLSSGEADQVEQKLRVDERRIKVIPSGLPFVWERSTLDEKGEKGLILSVGRLEAYKSIDRVLKAIPYLPDNHTLVLVGIGPAMERLKQSAQDLGIQERVKFLGCIPDEELWNWYSRARVAISLSEFESFGITVLEALASNCQVVCSDIPAFREFAREFPDMVSIVFSEANDKEVAAIIHSAMVKPQHEVNLQRFNWRRISREHLKLYDSLIARNKSKGLDRVPQSEYYQQ